MTGDGIWKTGMDIITVLTASAVHGIGAGITVHTGAFIGEAGAAVRGDITVSTTHGITEDSMIRGIMEDATTHGTMEDTGEDITPDIGDGTPLGTTTTITMAGTIRITTPVLHI